MSENLTFFVPYHTGYAHAELVRSFSSYTDVHLFIYKWNPARERIKKYFSDLKQIHMYEFSIDNIISQLIKEKHRKIVILLTASTNYLFGQIQLRLFRLIQQYISSIIDVYPVGHCMYGCQSCIYAYTHCLPITFTNYIQTKDEKLLLEKDFEILICPSYSFESAPFKKYDEPNGNEIEKLVHIRQWIIIDKQNNQEESFDIDTIKQTIHNEFKSISTPMTLYTLGELSMSEIEQSFFSDENQLFDVMQNNVNEL
ncbi:unnamed protein product [Rotaria sp. Silwood2]|nr:unnamed protein product [Rotaria sp. Silwood2]